MALYKSQSGGYNQRLLLHFVDFNVNDANKTSNLDLPVVPHYHAYSFVGCRLLFREVCCGTMKLSLSRGLRLDLSKATVIQGDHL